MTDIFNKTRYTILDGALGTMLIGAGLRPGQSPESMTITAPEKLTEIHRQYVDAGADIICANTFGANRKKLEAGGFELQDAIKGAVACARAACGGKDVRVALDVGPLGEMLEPGGTMTFEKAYELFSEMVTTGEAAGADLILIETMTDLYEAKAALLAAKENTRLPVFASMTFEQSGRTFSGVPVEAMALTLGGLGADALGINCSLGPAEVLPIAKRLCASTHLPVFVKPNAGLPDPVTGNYTLSPEDFCRQMESFASIGVQAVGGCCGTTPDCIRGLRAFFGVKTPVASEKKAAGGAVCSGTRVVSVDKVCPVGERINPTGKKRLQEALLARDFGYIQKLAVQQEEDGAVILDVNVGAPGINEAELLPLAVKAVQAVSGLPLQLDSANPKALEAALRVVNGKALVNSTSGEKDKLNTILPICRRYGAMVVGLTMDERGIPETAEGRLGVAKNILDAALASGIPCEDVVIDCLTMTVGTNTEAARVTLDALKMVKRELGLKTTLGVSNISFGLPSRPLINQTFLTMAMEAGLDLPILNPSSREMMGAVAAHTLLSAKDRDSMEFIARFGAEDAPATAPGGAVTLGEAIEKGLREDAAAAAEALICGGATDAISLLSGHMIPALDKVGSEFEKGIKFLPQLLSSASAAQAAFDVIRSAFPAGDRAGPPIVVATVQGDIHDIGKNIAKALLENYGYSVIDLGRDVPPERVVEAARDSGARLVGLSALMTTTLPAMELTIKALREAELPCKIMVGGAVITEPYALSIGADYHASDAKRSVDIAREVCAPI